MKINTYMVIESERDGLGRASFTLYWLDPDGVFRAELSKEDDKPVGYRRAQCFKAIPEDYIKLGAKLVDSAAIAKRLAWAVTAENITEAQIIEATAFDPRVRETKIQLMNLREWALTRGHVQRHAARARCAEILNALSEPGRSNV